MPWPWYAVGCVGCCSNALSRTGRANGQVAGALDDEGKRSPPQYPKMATESTLAWWRRTAHPVRTGEACVSSVDDLRHEEEEVSRFSADVHLVEVEQVAVVRQRAPTLKLPDDPQPRVEQVGSKSRNFDVVEESSLLKLEASA